jgi:HK97 family phage prohead protease
MSEQPTGPLELRSARLENVSFPQRTIDVMVMPYEEETLVEHQGRMIKEVVSRGAFDGIQRRPNRIKAYRDHDERKPVGKAVSLHERDDGLLARLKISRTELGEETLILADDGVLDASAGFLPMPGGEKWLTRSSHRIEKAWLGHIALVPEAAYEGAQVLAVRHRPAQAATDASTPNLDQVRDWLLEDRYEQLSRQIEQ